MFRGENSLDVGTPCPRTLSAVADLRSSSNRERTVCSGRKGGAKGLPWTARVAPGQVHARIGHNEPNQPTSVHTIDNKPYIFLRTVPGGPDRIARMIFILRKALARAKFVDAATRPRKSHQLSSSSLEQSATNRAIPSQRLGGYLRSVKKLSIRFGALRFTCLPSSIGTFFIFFGRLHCAAINCRFTQSAYEFLTREISFPRTLRKMFNVHLVEYCFLILSDLLQSIFITVKSPSEVLFP